MLLIGFTNAPCHRCVISSSLAVASFDVEQQRAGPKHCNQGISAQFQQSLSGRLRLRGTEQRKVLLPEDASCTWPGC